jgi:hemerythrin superfamily protein
MAENILDILRNEHKKTIEYLESFDPMVKKTDREAKGKILEEATAFLLAHMHAEEEVFYPELKPDLQSQIQDAYDEHEEVKSMLLSFSKAWSSGRAWENKLMDLKNGILHHVRDEEGPVFDAAKRMLENDRLE